MKDAESYIIIEGNYAYLACGSQGIRIIDVSDPFNPNLEFGYITSDDARGITVSENHAFVAVDNVGVQVFDISDPTSPVIIETYSGVGVAQCIFYNEGYIYLITGSLLSILQYVP
ncbi:MAG: hypothetical protein V3W18_10285 [candidate division Zixibacteria bacterium]